MNKAQRQTAELLKVMAKENGWVISSHAISEGGAMPEVIGVDHAAGPDTTARGTYVEVAEGYDGLFTVLAKALHQAQSGKGKERHAKDNAFEDQPILQITKRRGIGFPLGQVEKKVDEAEGMIVRGDLAAAEREILGAINYLAAVAIEINQRATAQMKD